jgi:magnesium transporter
VVQVRTLVADGVGSVVPVDEQPEDDPEHGWVWIDVTADGDDEVAALLAVTERYGLDQLAVRDSIADLDMPKLDDFGHHVLAVFHGLRDDRVATYEVDCFLTDRHLVTVRQRPSQAIDALWSQVQQRPELGRIGVDELLALLADVLTRRLLRVLEAFDEQMEALVARALAADDYLLEDLTAVRADLAGIRRAVHPQRETLDLLRHSTSPLLTDAGRRRFSDAFDVASRAAGGLDEARAALAETLDAYRGAEARQATDVTKVLTVYAAIMLPLSLVAGFFGMNFENLPWLGRSWGWVAASALMVAIAVVSIGIFVAVGWVGRPSGRETGRVIGRGLLEATRTPVQLVGAVVEISTLPLRATGARLSRRDTGRRSDGTQDDWSPEGDSNP